MESTHEKVVNLTIAIPPRKLGDIYKAINDHVDSLKSKYIPEAEGVMLNWSDLQILNDNGIIVDDQPYTFWKIKFTAHVFDPIPGKLFKGKVHKIQKQYLIVRAMEYFTASIAIPESLYNDIVIQNLVVDQEIYFRLTNTAGGDYQGSIDDECIELTGSLVGQQMEIDSENIFDYAKDFEY
jgi:DNA-directed RNA polymerase subunit E'/Rpb7